MPASLPPPRKPQNDGWEHVVGLSFLMATPLLIRDFDPARGLMALTMAGLVVFVLWRMMTMGVPK